MKPWLKNGELSTEEAHYLRTYVLDQALGIYALLYYGSVQPEVRWPTIPPGTGLGPADKANYFFIGAETATPVNREQVDSVLFCLLPSIICKRPQGELTLANAVMMVQERKADEGAGSTQQV